MKPQDISNTPKKNRRSRLTLPGAFQAAGDPRADELANGPYRHIRPRVVLADSGVSSFETIGKPTLCAALLNVGHGDREHGRHHRRSAQPLAQG